MKYEYLKSNAILIALELLFVLSCFVLDRERFIYTNFLFYALLVIYFGVKKDFSLRDWLDSFKSGKQFWKEVFFTAFLLGLTFVLSTFLEGLFPHFDTKMISLKADNWLEMILFSTSTIFLPPVAEEVFYRKNLVSFKNSKILFLTTMLSMFLYALGKSATARRKTEDACFRAQSAEISSIFAFLEAPKSIIMRKSWIWRMIMV